MRFAVGDERLPCPPAPALEPGPADRLAEAGLRCRVGVEDHEQIAGGRFRAGIAAAGEAGVAAHRHEPRPRRQLAHDLGAAVAGLVLDDDQLVALAQLREQGGESLREIVAVLVGDDQD